MKVLAQMAVKGRATRSPSGEGVLNLQCKTSLSKLVPADGSGAELGPDAVPADSFNSENKSGGAGANKGSFNLKVPWKVEVEQNAVKKEYFPTYQLEIRCPNG